MGSTFARVKVWVSGEILTASDLNGEFDNILDNLTPAGVDDASADLTAMRAVTDPGEVGTESLAISLEGEIQRLRNIIKEITGEAQWYVTPSDTLLTAGFASGTSMAFFQAAAPTGWTQDTTNDDAILRVVDGAGGGTGGSDSVESPPTHLHTGPAHIHVLPIGANNADSILAINDTGHSGTFTATHSSSASWSAGGGGGYENLVSSSAGTGNTGATTGFSPKYIDMIICDKD